MTFKQLEALYWIARLGSFSEAAAKLHTTQSAISKRVQELELQFGAALFDRSHRNARLTAQGQDMFEVARSLLEERDAAFARLGRPQAVQRHIRIGVTELTAMTWLPRFIAAIQQAHPGVSIEPDVDMGLVLREKLMADQTDIIIVPDTANDVQLVAKPLGRVENAWMCKPGFTGGKRAMRLHELARHRLLTQGERSGTGAGYTRWLRSLNVQPGDTLVCNNLIALLGLTLSGMGVSYLPRQCLGRLIEAGLLEPIDVKPALPPVKYVALCKKERQSALFASIVRLAQEACDFTLAFQAGK